MRDASGRLRRRVAAFQEYMRLAPGDPSAGLDGDLNYAYRKFGDAAARYLEAYAKESRFSAGRGTLQGSLGEIQSGG